MKIIGGKLKGRNFYMHKDTKPTQNMTRKAIFDILGDEIEGVNFLELFAGSGAVGLEAYSRGAKSVTFVEKDSRCAEIIQENVELLGVEESEDGVAPCEVFASDAYALIKSLFKREKKYDIVFADPPYGRDMAKKALKVIGSYDILQPNCALMIEHEKREVLPTETELFMLSTQKKYGKHFLSLYRRKT